MLLYPPKKCLKTTGMGKPVVLNSDAIDCLDRQKHEYPNGVTHYSVQFILRCGRTEAWVFKDDKQACIDAWQYVVSAFDIEYEEED